jgi:hypothetical protein
VQTIIPLLQGKRYKTAFAIWCFSVVCLARRFAITAIILIAAWFLMLSYQIFTETALTTIAGSFPFLASSLNSNIAVAAFVCSFAWMFVLSSVISNLLFGQQKRIFTQFLIGLILTVTAAAIFEGLKTVGFDLSNPNTLLSSSYAQIFRNDIFAFFYLSLPFIFMIVVDLRAMARQHKK